MSISDTPVKDLQLASSERLDYEALMTHPGWLRLQAVEREWWRTQIVQCLEVAASDRDDAIALQKLRQVLAAQRAVEQLLARPSERLRDLRRAELSESPSESRRGGGL